MARINLLHTSELSGQIEKIKGSKVLGYLLDIIEKKTLVKALFEVPVNLLRFKNLSSSTLEALGVAEKLSDYGIISGLNKEVKSPDEPSVHLFSSTVPTHLGNSGADFFDEASALWRCLAETYERHLWLESDFYKNKTVFSSISKLKKNSLTINSLEGFSSEQRLNNSILAFSENHVFGWIKGRTILNDNNILCPIQLVSAHYANLHAKNPDRLKAKEPMLRWVVTTGLATGQTFDEALVKGILETLERDAFMRTFLNKVSPELIDMDKWSNIDPEIKKLRDNFKRYKLTVKVALLKNEFDIFVPIVMILDDTKDGPAFSMGASADFDLKRAITDAWAEAMACRSWLKKRFPFTNTKLNHPLGHMQRMKYYGLYENINDISFLWSGPYSNIEPDISIYNNQELNRAKYYKEKRTEITKILKKNNLDGLYVKLYDKKYKKIPLSVVQVVIPGTLPIHLDERIPYLGNHPHSANLTPHPFP